MKYLISYALLLVMVDCRKPVTNNCGDALLTTIQGFQVFKHQSGSLLFRAKMAIDADGSPRAYHPDNIGLDDLEHAKNNGKWVGIVTDAQGKPIIQKLGDPNPGYYVSQTSLFDTRFPITDPFRYVNAEKVPYIVLPNELMTLTGAGIGDMAYVFNTQTKIGAFAIVADEGPEGLLGEGSIFLATQVGILNTNPRNGGVTDPIIQYAVFPKSGLGNSKHRSNAEIEQTAKAAWLKVGGSQILACF
jgi:hypothetical protein